MSRLIAYRVVICAIALSLSACTAPNRSVTLDYPPKSTGEASSGNSQESSADRGTVYIGAFGDLRPYSDIVGRLFSLANNKPQLKARNSVGGWFLRAMESELSRAGYSAQPLAVEGVSGPVPTITGTLLQVYCHHGLVPEAKVSFEAAVTANNKVLVEGVYAAEAGIGTLPSREESCVESLAVGLQKALQAFISDLPVSNQNTI